MKRIITLLIFAFAIITDACAMDLKGATIVYYKNDYPLVGKMANLLADDIERVSGVRPVVTTEKAKGKCIILATTKIKKYKSIDLNNRWETYTITCSRNKVVVAGSDARGLAYGVLHISESIGVSPWYWWADVPVEHKDTLEYKEDRYDNPSVKYRGIFINDEDWGMKTWAQHTMEPELGNIGPKTYDKVCELILRLRGNMLAPAMHSCSDAFYSNPENQKVADSWGIMITTSHCEPLLFNNASKQEWDKTKDGEWNYMTNKEAILSKLDERIKSTAQYNNIYTMGMRGLHDEAMKGSDSPEDRAKILEQVFADQRKILKKYKKCGMDSIPQIFVPYKETLDIYDAGLKVPKDITIVWPDDNYGYLRRICDPKDHPRRGGYGIYYHLSYLGTPHDYLWLNTTPQELMHQELFKALINDVDRYWLLNVGDIKPMELGIQTFMDLAWYGLRYYVDTKKFLLNLPCTIQDSLLYNTFNDKLKDTTIVKDWASQLLNMYYHAAWDRKPEYMGYEIQWDTKENERLHDMPINTHHSARCIEDRMIQYRKMYNLYTDIESNLDEPYRTSLFQLIGYSCCSAYFNAVKFYNATLNHQTGSRKNAEIALAAQDSINALLRRYNSMSGGKWNKMMSEVPPGYVSQYQKMPVLTDTVTHEFELPKEQLYKRYRNHIRIADIYTGNDTLGFWNQKPFHLITGLGTEWTVLQLGRPVISKIYHKDRVLSIPLKDVDGDSIRIQISTLPLWPLSKKSSNLFGVAVDRGPVAMCWNEAEEWSYPWKLQVLSNRKDYYITLPLKKEKKEHELNLIIGSTGQMIQEITYESF